MASFYLTMCKACIYAAAVAFAIGLFTSQGTSLGAYIAGYSVLTLGIMIILTMSFYAILKANQYSSTVQTLYLIGSSSGPFIVMLGVISFVLYLLIKYKNNILEGNIAPGYNSFSNITVMLLMLQLYIIINSFQNEKMSNVTSSIVYLLGVLTGISSIILYTILKYYSTDGFAIN